MRSQIAVVIFCFIKIINGNKLNGFSLQGMFELEEQFNKQEPKEETFDEWLEKQLN